MQINKEKSQALVEFLTPQDASAALSLDGCSFAGSNLKIRRPKDYVRTTVRIAISTISLSLKLLLLAPHVLSSNSHLVNFAS
jgi:hypothetical protein